jgi:hypothetical protein
MSKFKKKLSSDPEPEEIPKELIQWAKEISFLKGPMELYFHGVLTYREAMEISLLAMTREYRNLMSRIIKKKVKQREDHSDLLPMLPQSSNPLALPPRREKETEHAKNRKVQKSDAPVIEV